MDFDYSTINREVLNTFPALRLPPSYRLQDGCGNGCYGDPPGYPSYFTRNVYTQHGNTPSHKGSAELVLLDRVIQRVGKSLESVTAKLRSLWLPLPIDHPRTIAWIRDAYQHHAHCYSTPDVLEYGKPKTLTRSCDFAHREFEDDVRFSDAWRVKEQAAVAAFNYEQDLAWARLAGHTENHRAAQRVREFYPDHAPDLDLIAHPPEHEGDWWTVYAQKPSPEACPGEARRCWGGKHPVNGSWCQVCGWHAQAT